MKISYKIDYLNLQFFWEWLTKNYVKNALVEIILMNITDKKIYQHVEEFSDKNPNIIMKKNCQIFINNFNDLKLFLNYKDNIFIKHTKVCYSILPRFMSLKKEIGGGYKYLKYLDFVFLDIEKTNHSKLSKEDEKYLNFFIEMVKHELLKYGLNKITKIHSGNGYHLLMKIVSKKIDDKRILGYKEFIKNLEELNTPLFKIDHTINPSRCIALPETWNHSAGRKVKIIKQASTINENFYIKKYTKKKKTFSQQNQFKTPNNIRKSLEYKLMVHPELKKGQIHTYLLFALKLLLKEKGYDNEKDAKFLNQLEDEINEVRGSNHLLNLDIGLEGKKWNPYIIKRWCEMNSSFCEKYNIKY